MYPPLILHVLSASQFISFWSRKLFDGVVEVEAEEWAFQSGKLSERAGQPRPTPSPPFSAKSSEISQDAKRERRHTTTSKLSCKVSQKRQ